MKEFWNDRYSASSYMYGEEPNRFLKEQLGKLPPGTILFPAEGEGRNAVHAARAGWSVSAFDYSSVAKEKAIKLAQKYEVEIEYEVDSIFEKPFQGRRFLALAAIFSHFPDNQKDEVFGVFDEWLAPGGTLIMEVFSKNHILYQKENPSAGGPKDKSMLYSIDQCEQAFSNYDITMLQEVKSILNEGAYHVGLSSLIRIVARKRKI